MTKYLLETVFYCFSLVILLLFAFCIYTDNETVLWCAAGVLGLACLYLHPRLLFWIMICAIPLSIEYQFSEQLGMDFPDEIFMISTTAVAVCILLYNKQAALTQILKNPLMLLFVLQLFWTILCAFNSFAPLLSVKYLLAKVWYLIPFVIVPQFVLSGRKSLQVLAACIVIPSLAGVLYALYRHSEFGFTFVSITDSVRPIYRNHVMYAASLSVAFSVILILLFYFRTKIPRTVQWFALILFAVAIFFSYTRGTWISILCSWIVLFFFYKKLVRHLMLGALFVVFLGISYLVSNNYYLKFKPKYDETVFHEDFSEHINAMYALKEISASERIYRWVAGFKMSTVHPVLGFGPSTFYSSYKKYTDKRFKTYVSDNPERSTVHNYFLLTLIEQGYMGLFFLLLLILSFYFRCEFLFHRIRDRLYRGVLLILCLVMTNLLVVNLFSDMIETDKVGTMYFLCFGVLIWIDNKFRAGALERENERAFTTS